MSRRQRVLSLGTRITVVMTILAEGLILVVGLGISSHSRATTRVNELEAIENSCQMMAHNLEVAVTFDDPEDATQGLMEFQTQAAFLNAAVYLNDGTLFAAARRNGTKTPRDLREETLAVAGVRSEHDRNVGVHPIIFTDERIGTLYSEWSRDRQENQGRVDLAMLSVAMALILISSFFVARALNRRISRPIVQLTAAVQEVEYAGERTVSVASMADDEVGALVLGINHMLETIRRHRTELRCHRDALEQTVQLRTEQLTNLASTLRAEKERAESATLAKSQFLANLNHELRTPLNAIIAMGELALEEAESKAQRERLTTIRCSSELLLALIDDILDWSALESQQIRLESVRGNPASIVGMALKGLAVKAHGLGLDLTYFCSRSVPSSAFLDAARLRRVTCNLVDNAIKFTPEGAVRVRLEALDGHLQLVVEDTGVGIPEERRERIFAAFSQGDGSATREFGGVGLGLSITRRFVALMGGSVHLSSQEGQGTTFVVSIPVTADPVQTPPPDFREHRAFILSANDALAEALTEVFVSVKMDSVRAADPSSALRAYSSALCQQRPFDVMVVDEGFTQEALSPLNSLAAAPRIIQLRNTAHAAAPLDSDPLTLTKPVTPTELIESLVALFREPEGHAAKAPFLAHDSEPRGLRVLLAEDNRTNQRVALAILARRDHRVTVANDGLEALRFLSDGRFDVVLMDTQMPKMSGPEATRLLRAREAGFCYRTPVIALTANVTGADQEAYREAGVDAVLAKPLRLAALDSVLLRVLSPSSSTGG